MRHFIPAALAVALLAACSESSTEPTTREIPAPTSEIPAPPTSYSAGLPGTSASITSGSCSLISSSTGEVRCSYDVANPDGLLLNIYPGARLKMDYQCVSPSTGRVQSGGSDVRWAVGADVYGVTATNPTATNVKLSTPTVPNNYVHKDSKFNACKGKQTLVVTNYAMQYWEIYLDNWYAAQPNTDYIYTCLASDSNYRGCETS
jgi:hypothetical protein